MRLRWAELRCPRRRRASQTPPALSLELGLGSLVQPPLSSLAVARQHARCPATGRLAGRAAHRGAHEEQLTDRLAGNARRGLRRSMTPSCPVPEQRLGAEVSGGDALKRRVLHRQLTVVHGPVPSAGGVAGARLGRGLPLPFSPRRVLGQDLGRSGASSSIFPASRVSRSSLLLLWYACYLLFCDCFCFPSRSYAVFLLLVIGLSCYKY